EREMLLDVHGSLLRPPTILTPPSPCRAWRGRCSSTSMEVSSGPPPSLLLPLYAAHGEGDAPRRPWKSPQAPHHPYSSLSMPRMEREMLLDVHGSLLRP